jgi:hypothetical protein
VAIINTVKVVEFKRRNNMHKVIQITPANDWVYKDVETCSMIPVAVWALLENGDIVGMVSEDDFTPTDNDKEAGLKLIAPSGGGYYMRLNQPLHVE